MIFEDLNLSRQLYNAIDDLGFTNPTPIQEQVCSVVLSGRDVVGIAQTGTGKTLAYLLPLLRDLKYSKTNNPRILILVPTRELVIQVVQQVESLTKYMTVRVQGVYGGANINTQAQRLVEGLVILGGTPGSLYV
jgi:ATP-dependent RNA helicase RhlE